MVITDTLMDLSVDQLLNEALQKEGELLSFYERLLPHSDYDVHQLFEQMVEGTIGRMKRLEEMRRNLAELRILTEPMAD